MPAISSLLISLVVIRLFSSNIWGVIVGVLIIQQISTGLLNWGNKDYIQKSLADSPSEFGHVFSAFFLERVGLLLITIVVLYAFQMTDYNLPLILLVIGHFIRQSFDVLVLQKRLFVLFSSIELAILAIQIAFLFYSDGIAKVLYIMAFGSLLRGLIPLFWFLNQFKAPKWKQSYIVLSGGFALIAIAGFLASKVDLLVFKFLFESKPALLGEYQVYMAFAWSIQALALYFASPYVPHFYRLRETGRISVESQFLKVGLVVVPLAVGASHAVLTLLFEFQFDIRTVPLLMVLGFNAFLLTPIIYRLYAQKKQMLVAGVIAAATLVLPLLIFAADAFIELNLIWSIFLVCIHNSILVLAFHLIHSRQTA